MGLEGCGDNNKQDGSDEEEYRNPQEVLDAIEEAIAQSGTVTIPGSSVKGIEEESNKGSELVNELDKSGDSKEEGFLAIAIIDSPTEGSSQSPVPPTATVSVPVVEPSSVDKGNQESKVDSVEVTDTASDSQGQVSERPKPVEQDQQSATQSPPASGQGTKASDNKKDNKPILKPVVTTRKVTPDSKVTMADKNKQSPLPSPSNNMMKPGTPVNLPPPSPRSSPSTPSPAPKAPTPSSQQQQQMQQIVVVASGQPMSSGINSMTSGTMSFTTSPHNMISVQNAMIQQQQQQMLMAAAGQGVMNPGMVNQGMGMSQGLVNQQMITQTGHHQSPQILMQPTGTFLSAGAQPIQIWSNQAFSNNNPNLIIQQPFLQNLSVQSMPQTITSGNNVGNKIAMPKNYNQANVINTINKPG